jgi:hypothetical protein
MNPDGKAVLKPSQSKRFAMTVSVQQREASGLRRVYRRFFRGEPRTVIHPKNWKLSAASLPSSS